MLMDTNEIIGSEAMSPKDEVAPADIGFFGAISTKWKQNALTDLGLNRSESSAYIDTINEIYPDMELNVAGKKGLNQSNYDLLNSMWDEGYFEVGEDGVIRGTEKYKSRGIIHNKYMPSDFNVAAVNNLRNKGFSPDSLHTLVVDKTKKQWMDNEKDLRYYDDTNLPGASGLSEFTADIGIWLADPINATGLGVEIGAFKLLSKGLLREGRSSILELKSTFLGSNTGKQLLAKSEKLTSKYGNDAIKEVSTFIKQMKTEGLSSKDIIAVIKNKGTGKSESFVNKGSKKMITDAIRNENLQEIFAIAGFSGVIGGITEVGHQAGTFDWKTQIVPYTEKDKNRDIALSAGFGFVFAGAFNLVGNLLGKTDAVSTAIGVELSETTSKVIDEIEVKKIASDIEDSISVDGLETEIEEILPINFEKDGDSAIEATLGDEELLKTLDPLQAKDLDTTMKQLEQWDKIDACFNSSL